MTCFPCYLHTRALTHAHKRNSQEMGRRGKSGGGKKGREKKTGNGGGEEKDSSLIKEYDRLLQSLVNS